MNKTQAAEIILPTMDLSNFTASQIKQESADHIGLDSRAFGHHHHPEDISDEVESDQEHDEVRQNVPQDGHDEAHCLIFCITPTTLD